MKEQSYEYVQGASEPTCYESVLECCGNIVGCSKAWCPCLCCLCCTCNHPYVVLEQGHKGLLLRFGFHYLDTRDMLKL